MVNRCGAGPPAIPIAEVSWRMLADAFRVLQKPETAKAAALQVSAVVVNRGFADANARSVRLLF